jgi:hypothetical protein
MDIHLLRTEKVSDELYDAVFTLLEKFQGPLLFRKDERYVFFNDREWTDVPVTKKEFTHKDRGVHYLESRSINIVKKFEIPETIQKVSWEVLFDKSRTYRRINNTSQDSAIVLLTEKANELNWFSAGDPNGDWNFFVHTDHWEFFVEGENYLPVAYEVVTSILHKFMFGDYRTLEQYVHKRPRGCISDFCQEKRDVTYKMRTADICHACQELIITKNVPRAIVGQVIRIMEHIRLQLLFRERFPITQNISRLKVTADLKIEFVDMDNAVLPLTPIERAVYILFLENPEGIASNEMDQHRERLRELYLSCFPGAILANIENTLNDLINPLENSLSSKCSVIKRKITNLVGAEMAEHYIIKGDRGERKRIGLERGRVEWG